MLLAVERKKCSRSGSYPVSFDPRIRDGKTIRIQIRDEQPGSYFRKLRNNFLVKILKFFDAYPDWEKFGFRLSKFFKKYTVKWGNTVIGINIVTSLPNFLIGHNSRNNEFISLA
jgi:hypothetical protein